MRDLEEAIQIECAREDKWSNRNTPMLASVQLD